MVRAKTASNNLGFAFHKAHCASAKERGKRSKCNLTSINLRSIYQRRVKRELAREENVPSECTKSDRSPNECSKEKKDAERDGKRPAQHIDALYWKLYTTRKLMVQRPICAYASLIFVF